MDVDLLIRLGAFLGVLGLMATWETLAPRRRLLTTRLQHWRQNLSLAVVNAVVVRLLFAGGAMAFAMIAAERGWGVLNLVSLPAWAELVIAVVVLDLVIYVQHVTFHLVPVFWRVHMVHHADPDYDVTTGVRFHPVEAILSMMIRAVAILLLGAPPVAVLSFEVLLNATAMFNHGNVGLPQSLDRLLRWIVVTPDMHRVHHSIYTRERNRNFGFNLPWWDYLFRTYRPEPEDGHQGMTIGLEQFREPARMKLGQMLMLPFRSAEQEAYPRPSA